MKKWEKEILAKQIQDESQVTIRIEQVYKKALEEIDNKIMALKSKEQIQSVIYQTKYQEQLKNQIQATYDKLTKTWYDTIDEYLKNCYEDSFYSTMYALHQEGIPIVIPFNQKEVAQASAQDSYHLSDTLSDKLYSNTFDVARKTVGQISKGMAMNESYATIATNIANRASISVNNALRITRTEGHRITNEVKMKTIAKVQDEGADVVKQWDSAIDRRTRPTHVELDGQLREIDQPFKIPSTGATAMYPGGFGIAKEDINCRCALLQRARWALDKSEVEKMVGDLEGVSESQLDEWAKKFGITKDELIKASNGIIESDGSINHRIKAKSYNEFKKKYKTKEKAQEQIPKVPGMFPPEAYGEREKEAWKNRFFNKEEADVYYRSELDDNWDNYTDYEKYSIWKYTENSNPLNKPLSGYANGSWSRYDHDGVGKVPWGTEDDWRTLNSDEFIKKFGKNGTSNIDHFKTITNLTKAIDKSEISKDVFLVRGDDPEGLAGWMESIVDYDDALNMIKNDPEKLKNTLEGQIIKNHAFTSTGIASGAGFTHKKVSLNIYAPKGTKGIYAEPQSYYGATIGMNETIYKKGMHYSYVGSEAEIILQRGTSYRIKKVTETNGDYEIDMEIVDQPNYFKHGDEETFNNGATRHKG